jgi:hypothetical protein
MRFYTGVHEACCGIDRHARAMVRLSRQPRRGAPVPPADADDPEILPKAIAPSRQDLVVAVACMLAFQEHIPS